MKRKSCTDCTGNPFSKKVKDEVWSKREPHLFFSNYGYDKFGNKIRYEDYGKVSKKYGWDIDHSKPVSIGGSDSLNNLQPLQSYYNRHIKSDYYPWRMKNHVEKGELPGHLTI